MLPDTWQNARRVLVIQLGSIGDVELTVPALLKLHQSLPDAAITLMTAPAGGQAGQLPWVNDILVYEGAIFTPNREEILALIQTLSRRAFDAAIIFTNAGESPYPLAYICYLAGIPIRLGQSQEFGGSILSQWVKCQTSDTQLVERHLFLLESAGFPK